MDLDLQIENMEDINLYPPLPAITEVNIGQSESTTNENNGVNSYTDTVATVAGTSQYGSYSSAISGVEHIGNKISYFPSKIIGTGGLGAIVYKGKWEGRRNIAVKCMNSIFYQFIDKEIDLLNRSDRHRNVIRYFGSEAKGQLRYIALEFCETSLWEWVHGHKNSEGIGQVDPIDILHQCTLGLNYIHSKNVVHRDIKPSNILLRKDGTEVIVQITDFGLGKKMDEGKMSYTNSGKDTGTQGWKAPEVKNKAQGGRMNPKVDIFSLGCVYYFVLTGGSHPFGDLNDQTLCQYNIRTGNHTEIDIPDDTQGIAELISMMIFFEPSIRPPASAILDHPMFWDEEKIANFFDSIKNISRNQRDWVKEIIKKFEEGRDKVFHRNWMDYIPNEFRRELQHGRWRYNGATLRDLIRALRNNHAHYEDLPFEVKMEIGSRTEYIRLWLRKFPNLLPYTWEYFEPLKKQSGLKDRNFYNTRHNFFQTKRQNQSN